MIELVDAKRPVIRRFFDDNRHHYQSPVRFKLRILQLAFGDDPPAHVSYSQISSC